MRRQGTTLMDVMPKWVDAILIPILSILISFVLSGLVILYLGMNPFEALQLMITGALGSTYGWGFTLYFTTNFIFTGLCAATRLSRPHVQHRRRRSGDTRRIGRGPCLPRRALAPLDAGAARRDPWRGAVRGRLGLYPRLAASQARQPHRDHHDHVQLYRLGAPDLSSGRGPETRRLDGPGHPPLWRGREPAEPRRNLRHVRHPVLHHRPRQRQLLHRPHRAFPLLAPDLAHQARL